jgi:hypothetical protein
VAEAVIGLIGVVVGGVLTGGVAYVLERRRETREAQIARRVMRAQFGQTLKAVDDGLKGKNWPPGWKGKRWSDSWVAHRQALAAKMSDDDFATLAQGRSTWSFSRPGSRRTRARSVPATRNSSRR